LRGTIRLLGPDFLELFPWFVSHSLAFANGASIQTVYLQNTKCVKKACFSAAYAKQRHDRAKVVDILVNDLKVFSTFNEELYKETTQLLTLENF